MDSSFPVADDDNGVLGVIQNENGKRTRAAVNGDNGLANATKDKSTSIEIDRSLTSSIPTEEFVNKFRRLRACARCHRLKMRCVFEDPTYESCTRCFKSGLACSMTQDPTQSKAKTRSRKRSKLIKAGDGPLSQLQKSINDSFKLLQSFQGGGDANGDTEVDGNDESIKSNSKSTSGSVNMNKSTSSSSTSSNKIEIEIEMQPNQIDESHLTTLQIQLTELQRLLSHVIKSPASKKISTTNSTTIANVNNIKKDKLANSANSMKDGPVKTIPALPWISYDQNIIKELIKLDILTIDIAKNKMKFFFNELHSYWPCISFPEYYTFEYLIDNEPLVLLSIITVTCLNEPDLHDSLLYYLEDNLSVRTSITGEINTSFIQIYIILSLWCSPPRKWGSYKHQMSLLMALNLTLCLDLGNEINMNNSNVLKDDSKERKIIRSYMSVYSCCGSLGLSLPRFKVVNWTPVHEKYCQLLLLGQSNDSDKFLFFYSKLVSLGEEIFQYLCPNGFPSSNLEDINNVELRSKMIQFEQRMQKLAMESGMFSNNCKIKNLLSIIYYQLLMTMYDYIVCKVLLKREILTEVYQQTLNRLIKASEKVIQSFELLCDETFNIPTFFYYRPMHALVALIRARLLVKTQKLEFEINVEQEYEKVSNSLKKLSTKSKVGSKMGDILSRITKWMKVSSKFNKNGATNSMVDLLNELGSEKAIEKIQINLKNKKVSKEEGDNANLSDDSKIQFTKFINFSMDSIRRRSARAVGGDDKALEKEKSAGIPSPIGYSQSEIMVLPSSQGNENPEQQSIVGTGWQRKTPEGVEYTRKSESGPAPATGIGYYSMGGDDMGIWTSMPVGMPVPVATPIQQPLAPPEHSLNEDYIAGTDGPVKLSNEELAQQDILADIFNQIDTDIMHSNDGASPKGMAPMFDFLGGSNTEWIVPEDWLASV
ncbi:hypothetical protein DAMA08_015190 [Martiniozyma asiatica (nom. inval.)]|nr:hypothetical protein DAMA08_015190 [Martiniozyma asiatica]